MTWVCLCMDECVCMCEFTSNKAKIAAFSDLELELVFLHSFWDDVTVCKAAEL